MIAKCIMALWNENIQRALLVYRTQSVLVNEEDVNMANNNDWKKIERTGHRFEEVGSEVSGKLLRVEEGEYGENFILDINGTETTIFGKTALKSKMQAVKVGQDVKIVYVGEKKSSNGRLYMDFEVYTK